MTVRELVTRLTYQTDQSSLTRAQRGFRNLQRAAAAVTGAAAAAGAATVQMARDTAARADDIAKGARAAGLSAENFQELQFALGQAGVAEDQFQRIAERTTQRMGMATAGNENYQEAFANLGVSIQDANGEMRSSDAVMDDVIDAVSSIEDPARRAAAAGDLLGVRAGRQLAGALADGGGGAAAARQQFQDLGLALSDDTLNASEGLNDSLETLGLVVQSIKDELGAAFIPTIQSAATTMREFFSAHRTEISEALQIVIQSLTQVFSNLFSIGQSVFGVVQTVMGAFSGLTGDGDDLEQTISRIANGLTAFVIAVGVATAAVRTYTAVTNAIRIATTAWNAIKRAATGIQWAWNAAMAANPIGLIIAAIAALVAAGIALVKNWDTVLEVTRNVWGAIAEFFTNLWETIKNIFRSAFDWMVDLFMNFHPLGLLIDNWDAVLQFFSGLWDTIGGIFQGAYDWISGIIQSLADIVGNILGGIMDTIGGVVETVGNVVGGIGDAVGGAIEGVGNFFGFGGDDNGEAERAETARPSARGNTRNINVNSSVQVGVPSGTESGVAAEAEARSRRGAEEVFDRRLREAIENNPDADFAGAY